jgi:hypothetical protein
MNNQNAPYLKRRLALLLLISVIDFVVSPLLIPLRVANTEAAPLNPFDGPTIFIRQIPLTTNDLVYSASTGKLYASVPSSAGNAGNSIAAIDPTSGVVNSSTFIGSEPNKLALSDDGNSLYVWLDGSLSFRRFDTVTNTPGLQFSMGQDSVSGRYIARDFAVAPGNASVLAVARTFINVSAPAGVAIFDNGVRRPNVAGGNSDGSNSLAFSASASKLYGADFSGFQTMIIDASGVSVRSTSSLAANARIKFSNGLVFTSSGQVINPEINSLLGTLAADSQAFVPDAAAGRAYYLTSGPSSTTLTLKAFDVNTFALLGSIDIGSVVGSPTSLVRWGANGLAFRTTGNQLFIIQTSLIPSAEPVPTPTPTPSPTPSPSPSPAPALFVKQVTLTTNDLIYNQGTQKLYASVPSSEGSTGNSITEIDPVAGSISNQTFIGSEPTELGMADDGATLYVGLDGAAAIRKYNILTHTAGQQFYIGRHTDNGPYGFTDLAVAPGNPSIIAVARQFRNFGGANAGGVAIFDNGVQLPNTGPTFFDGSSFLAFASPSILYGNDFHFPESLTTMTVDGSGVTVTGKTPFIAGNAMILANGLLYGSKGQVINPTTGELIGTFIGTFNFGAAHAVDPANGRVFFVGFTSSGVQLRAYDINTFVPLGSVNIPGVTGTPSNLVRWGSNGLAFRTNSGQVFMIETALVNASVPVSSPTPTPSPTPSPSPPYIPTFVRRVNLPANNLVYSQATQALHASVPGSAGANGNSITKIIPETGEVGPSVFIGSEPGRMAISSDGQSLWVRLNGANAFRRFDILTQTPGLQFAANSVFPLDMDVVPGSPQSLVVINGSFDGGVVIFDDGVQRPKIGALFPRIGAIEFGANPSILYGVGNGSTNTADLVKDLVDASGVTTSTVTKNLFISSSLSDQLKFLTFSNGLLYSGSGRIVDPENRTWLGIVQPTFNATSMCVDAANHRVFFGFNTLSNAVRIQAFDTNTFLPIGSIILPDISSSPVNLVRWGTNGLAFNTVPPVSFNEQGKVYLVQSELVSSAGTIPIGLELERTQFSVSEFGSSLQVKVLRTGNDAAAVSVDYATSDGTATAGPDYVATSGTLNFAPGELSKIITIPITDDFLFENGNETFTITLSNPTNSAVLQTPSATITILDNDFKPSIFVSTNAIRIREGDSGTKDLRFPIFLSNPSVQVVTVDYKISDGTATAGSDYITSSGTITVPPGATNASINIPIIGDTIIEPNETFDVSLMNGTNISFLQSGQTAVIDNDDASVQLSNTTFTVNEGAGFATVSLTRAGDTSHAATVFYSTTDAAGLQTCTLANGKASERCDYGTSVGTVQFGIGQTTRTFTIPIVDDALVEGDETFTVNLNGPGGAALGTPSTAVITIVDNDTAPASQNPVDGVDFFVTQQYIDFLGRLPDSIGLANWIDTLGNCPDAGFGENANPSCDRVHVSAGFFLSEEFRGRGYFAYKFYEVGFDRRPTYLEFVPDMAEVGGAQSPESEVLSKAAYTDAFVQRQEFKNRYDALSNSDYVNALETNAEVTLTNKAALIDALNLNQKTRAQVLREIVELQSVSDKFFIRAFVAMQYFGYLRRDPDTIGYNNWVTTLTADPNNFRHMIFGFVFSDEYRHRFGP